MAEDRAQAQRPRFLPVVAGLAAASVLCGRVAGQEPGAALTIVGAAAIVGLSFTRPLAGVLGLMATQLYLVGTSSGIDPGEIFFQVLYVCVFAGWASHRIVVADERLVPTELNRPLFALSAALLFSFFPALYHGNGIAWWVRDLSPMLNYLVFFIVVNTAPRPRDLRALVSIFLAFCYLVTLRDLLYFSAPPGSGPPALYGILERYVVRGPGGAAFWQSAFLLCLGRLLYETRPRRIALLMGSMAYFGATMLLSGTRTYWISSGIVFLLALLLAGRLRRGAPAGWPFRVALLGGVAAAVGGALMGDASPTALRLRERAGLLGSFVEGGGAVVDPSVLHRLQETQTALDRIARHPVVGYGLGYRIPFRGLPGVPGEVAHAETTFLHNGYLFLLLKLGAVGLAVFLWFLWRLVRVQWIVADALRDPGDKGLAFGFLLSVVGIAVMSVTTSKFADAPTTLFLGVFSGILYVRARWEYVPPPAVPLPAP